MIIKIHNAATGADRRFSGNVDAIKQDLLEMYPFLKRYKAEDISQMIYHINRQQYYFVTVEG